jgi:hypothetical protein
MSWQRLRDCLDNPILVKHARSRLRIHALAVSVAVVVVLSLCIMWGGYELNWLVTGRAFEMLLLLQAIILIMIGASQVSTAVAGARASGILDFHRISPMTPRALVLGFFFGAPIREYVLFASTLPFAVFCLAFGAPTAGPLARLLILLVASAWFFHGLTLLNGLVIKSRPSPRGAVVATVVVILLLVNALRMSRIFPSSILFEDGQQLSFFSWSLPWLAVVLLDLGAALFFMDRAACRMMESERNHALSKPQALAGMATTAVLLSGAIWRRQQIEVLLTVSLYLLSIVAIVLVLVVTPTAAEYWKGLWRALKQEHKRLRWWHDLALNQVFLLIICTLVLVTASIGWSGAVDPVAMQSFNRMTARAYSLATAAAVLVVAYFGLAYQYFTLRFGARGRVFFSLFLFLFWLIPLLGGSILAAASSAMGGDIVGRVVVSASPIVGIGMTAYSNGETDDGMLIRAAALTPALLFAFVFQSLLVSARRRAHRRFAVAVLEARREEAVSIPDETELANVSPVSVSPILESEDA